MSCRTQDQTRSLRFPPTGLSPSTACLPMHFVFFLASLFRLSYNPAPENGLGSSAFARRYLRNRFYFLFLQVLRCFTSLRLALLSQCHLRGGFPHSDIDGYLRVLTARRRVSPFAASFFALQCPGILHTLFFAFPKVCSLSFLQLFLRKDLSSFPDLSFFSAAIRFSMIS